MADTRVSSFSVRLKDAQVRLAMIALAIMIATTSVDVALRFLFNSPIRGAYDIVEASLVVFVFHGMSASFLARKNIVIDVIDGIVGKRAQAILIHASDLISIGILGLVIAAMTVPALQAFDYGDRKLELGLPLWVLWIFAIVGLLGTFASACASAFRAVAPRDSAPPERSAE